MVYGCHITGIGRNSNFKDNRVEWLLLSTTTDALENYNERLLLINRQLKRNMKDKERDSLGAHIDTYILPLKWEDRESRGPGPKLTH